MRPINLIVIHCSASPNGDSLARGAVTPAETIDGWHRARGFRRDDGALATFNPALKSIGYHYVIGVDGHVATGRALAEIGAHVVGQNKASIGICMIGIDRYRRPQWLALADLIAELRKTFPDARVVGHRDLSPDRNGDGLIEPWEWLKTCPGFNVAAWLDGGMHPLSNHLLESA